MTTVVLRPPTAALFDSWLQSWDEWGTADQDGAGVFFAQKFGWDLRSPQGFARWVQLLNEMDMPGAVPPEGFAPQSTLWLERAGEYLGAVSLRHTLMNDFLEKIGGHIGYGIRPGARGQGLAKLALAGALDRARELGLHRVLSPATTRISPQRRPSRPAAANWSALCRGRTSPSPSARSRTCAATGSGFSRGFSV